MFSNKRKIVTLQWSTAYLSTIKCRWYCYRTVHPVEDFHAHFSGLQASTTSPQPRPPQQSSVRQQREQFVHRRVIGQVIDEAPFLPRGGQTSGDQFLRWRSARRVATNRLHLQSSSLQWSNVNSTPLSSNTWNNKSKSVLPSLMLLIISNRLSCLIHQDYNKHLSY